jgi:hypothetical protein
MCKCLIAGRNRLGFAAWTCNGFALLTWLVMPV